MSKKLLSIVIVGRNDDYLGGYRYRLETCLEFLASNLEKLSRSDDVEVLFVDWNSPGDPLSKELNVSPSVAKILRFLEVSPEVAAESNLLVSFFTTCAVNVGVRRAQGEFIMLADSDSLMPLTSLESLLKVLDGSLPVSGNKNELVYPISRHQIPGAIAARKPKVTEWEEILRRIYPSRRKELPGADCLGGFSAAQLMHRDLWMEFGGYNERLNKAWGWSDNELMFRVTQRYAWMDLDYYGVVAFHIEHKASTGNEGQRDPSSVNDMFLTYKRHPNDANWGLADREIPVKRPRAKKSATQAEPGWPSLKGKLISPDAFNELLGDSDTSSFANELIHGAYPDGPPTRFEVDIIAACSAFMLHEFPRHVFHFGGLSKPVLDTLIKAHPGIDLFLIRPWGEGRLEEVKGDPGFLSMALANSGYRGYSRIVSGPSVDAINALGDTEPGAQNIEFAILRRNYLDDEFDNLFPTILGRLAPGGCLILEDSMGRAPYDVDRMKRFIGRRINRQKLRAKSKASPVFVQHAEEAKIASKFEVISLSSGGVHIITSSAALKRKPADLRPSAAKTKRKKTKV